MSEEFIDKENIEIEHTEQIGEIMAALAKVQGKLPPAVKSKKNPFFKSSYADLPAVWEACREPLSQNCLGIVQAMGGTKEKMFLTTIMGHPSNQWIKSKVPLIMAKMDPQSMGSCITYARRYSLMAMIGICADDEDDDAEGAMEPIRKEKNKEPEKPKKPEPDISMEAVNLYLENNWPHEKGNFRKFMLETMEKKNYNYRTCIEKFMKHEDLTKTHFMDWLSKQKKEEVISS